MPIGSHAPDSLPCLRCGLVADRERKVSRRKVIAAVAAIGGVALVTSSDSFAVSEKTSARQENDMTLAWKDGTLSISSNRFPSGTLRVWAQEVWCNSTLSQSRDWSKTVIPHVTRLMREDVDGKSLELESVIGSKGIVRQAIRVVHDGVEFNMTLMNPTGDALDIEWGVTCIKVGDFTGLTQDTYTKNCFIFTEKGFTTLNNTRRTEEALYHGGQVYVPKGISPGDVNERPISLDVPVNGLIGCFSHDARYLLATAWEPTERLFQGILTCIHNDLRVGGLAPHQTKRAFGKIYFLRNDVDELLERYRTDFKARAVRGGRWT